MGVFTLRKTKVFKIKKKQYKTQQKQKEYTVKYEKTLEILPEKKSPARKMSLLRQK